MTQDEVKLHRLKGQHLLAPGNTEAVVQDLCGIQAQFLSHALHSLSIRCRSVNTDGLIKSWTLRGTMHLFSQQDLPLFLHEDRRHFLRDVDTMRSDAHATAQRKAFFADLILDAISLGTDTREHLKILCRANGMSETEEVSLFDPWGGLIRALCEEGRICHKVQQEKAYRLCPAFAPMSRLDAQRELARRYFTHFGPATVKDAAYFFSTTQREITQLLEQLPVIDFQLDDKVYFHIPDTMPAEDMPHILFLSGFDQLMLGYEKTENPFLPSEHLRQIFTRSGIVRPAILVDGTVSGFWNLKNRKLTITPFCSLAERDLRRAADAQWSDLKYLQIL